MFYVLHFLKSLFTPFCKNKPKQPKSMPPKFELYCDKAEEYRFRLKAPNGEIILVSEGYMSKASAENGILSVKRNACLIQRFERKKARNGKPMFNLKAANHKVIGTSEQYESTAARDKGIRSVMRNAQKARLVGLT